jgi:hypothetical protein
MPIRRSFSEGESWGTSFLDILSCSLGAMLVILFLTLMMKRKSVEQKEQLPRYRSGLAAARKHAETAENEHRTLEAVAGRLKDAQSQNRVVIDNLNRMIRDREKIQFLGIRADRDRVVLLVDLSYSTVGCRNDRELLVNAAKTLIQGLWRGKDSGHSFGVVAFGLSGAASSVALWDTLREATEANKAIAQKWIDELARDPDQAGGGRTFLLEACERALRIPTAELIILLTDGEPSDPLEGKDTLLKTGSPERLAKLLAAFQALKRRFGRESVGMRSVGVGPRLFENHAFRKFLVDLALPETEYVFTAL